MAQGGDPNRPARAPGARPARQRPPGGPARGRIVRARLVLVGAGGFLLVNYPVLSLVDRPETVAGVPVLWAYLFTVWVLLIVVLAIIVRGAE